MIWREIVFKTVSGWQRRKNTSCPELEQTSMKPNKSPLHESFTVPRVPLYNSISSFTATHQGSVRQWQQRQISLTSPWQLIDSMSCGSKPDLTWTLTWQNTHTHTHTHTELFVMELMSFSPLAVVWTLEMSFRVMRPDDQSLTESISSPSLLQLN